MALIFNAWKLRQAQDGTIMDEIRMMRLFSCYARRDIKVAEGRDLPEVALLNILQHRNPKRTSATQQELEELFGRYGFSVKRDFVNGWRFFIDFTNTADARLRFEQMAARVALYLRPELTDWKRSRRLNLTFHEAVGPCYIPAIAGLMPEQAAPSQLMVGRDLDTSPLDRITVQTRGMNRADMPVLRCAMLALHAFDEQRLSRPSTAFSALATGTKRAASLALFPPHQIVFQLKEGAGPRINAVINSMLNQAEFVGNAATVNEPNPSSAE